MGKTQGFLSILRYRAGWLLFIPLFVFYGFGFGGWFHSGEMYAEMATNLYFHAPEGLSAFQIPDFGYLPFFPRLTAFVVQLAGLGPTWVPHAYNLAAFLVLYAFALSLIDPCFESIMSWELRFFLALCLILLPGFAERTLINVSGLGLLTLIFWIALKFREPEKICPPWIQFLLFIPFSKTYALILAPALVGLGVLRKASRGPVLILLGFSLIQFLTMLLSHEAVAGSGFGSNRGLDQRFLAFSGYALAWPVQIFLGRWQGFLGLEAKWLTGLIFWLLIFRALYRGRDFLAGLLLFTVLGAIGLNCLAISADWNDSYEKVRHFPAFYRHTSQAILGTITIFWLCSKFRFRWWILWLAGSGWLVRGVLQPFSDWGEAQTGSSLWSQFRVEKTGCIPIDPPGWRYPEDCGFSGTETLASGQWSSLNELPFHPYQESLSFLESSPSGLSLRVDSLVEELPGLRILFRDGQWIDCPARYLLQGKNTVLWADCPVRAGEPVLLEADFPKNLRFMGQKGTGLPAFGYFVPGQDH